MQAKVSLYKLQITPRKILSKFIFILKYYLYAKNVQILIVQLGEYLKD